MSRSVKVGVIQMVCAEDRVTNLERALELTHAAAQDGADIVCLPELFLTPYFCQTEWHAHFDLAEPVPGPTTDAFAAAARTLNVTIIVSLFERRAAGLFHNTVAVMDAASGYLGKYRKMHIPDDPRYLEKFYFAPGDLGFKVFATPKASVGVLICWDQWYPEAARLTALRGADILFYPTAIGWHPEEKASVGAAQHDAWEVSQRAHAISNGCYVVAVNRAGFEATPGADGNEGIEFWGQSFVAAPDGTILHRAPESGESAVTLSLDLDAIERARTSWPFLRDRRIDAYGDLSRRFVD